jgi:quercetin dioxygenase-like cupin family protein
MGVAEYRCVGVGRVERRKPDVAKHRHGQAPFFKFLQIMKTKILDPNGLVAYAKDSIVSKTLVDRKAGTLTLFAFDRGQGLSEHVAPFDAVVEILDGEAQITIAGKPLKARAGEMVVMPANVPHALKAVKKFKMLLIMIRGTPAG